MEIKDLEKKTWKQLVSICKNESVLLALSREDELVDAVKLRYEQSPVAAACYISAVLMAKRSALMAIDAAAVHFKALADKHKMPTELHERIRIMEEQICWAGTPYRTPCPTDKWVVKPPKKYLEDHGGLLMFLLAEGLKRLSRERNVDNIAHRGATEFVDWVMGCGGLQAIKNGKSA
jgi:hypothetical protein